MWSSWWGFSDGCLSIDTFAKVAILYRYLFSLILPITKSDFYSRKLITCVCSMQCIGLILKISTQYLKQNTRMGYLQNTLLDLAYRIVRKENTSFAESSHLFTAAAGVQLMPPIQDFLLTGLSLPLFLNHVPFFSM